MQVLGKAFMRVPRYIWTLIGAVVYIVVAILLVTFTSSFNETLNSFMLLVAYWLGPYAIILVIEHFVYRRGRYNVDDWNTASRLPLGWAAIVSMVVGLIGAYLGFSQALVVTTKTLTALPGVTETLFGCSGGVCTWGITGVLGGLVNGGMDIGFELGLVLAGISYLVLRAVEIRTSRRSVVEAVAGE